MTDLLHSAPMIDRANPFCSVGHCSLLWNNFFDGITTLSVSFARWGHKLWQSTPKITHSRNIDTGTDETPEFFCQMINDGFDFTTSIQAHEFIFILHSKLEREAVQVKFNSIFLSKRANDKWMSQRMCTNHNLIANAIYSVLVAQRVLCRFSIPTHHSDTPLVIHAWELNTIINTCSCIAGNDRWLIDTQ